MRQDKAGLRIGGKTLLERAVEALEGAGLEVKILSGSNWELPFFQNRTCPDLLHGVGPLAGLYTGLSVTTSDRAAFLACDLPFVSSRFLTWLLRHADPADITVPSDSAGAVQPLCGVFSRNCLPAIRWMLANRKWRLQDLLNIPTLKVQTLPASAGGFSDLQLFNWNSPEDLELLKNRVARIRNN